MTNTVDTIGVSPIPRLMNFQTVSTYSCQRLGEQECRPGAYPAVLDALRHFLLLSMRPVDSSYVLLRQQILVSVDPAVYSEKSRSPFQRQETKAIVEFDRERNE